MNKKDAAALVREKTAARDELNDRLTGLLAGTNGRAPSKKAQKQIEALQAELENARREVKNARVCLRRAYGGKG